MTTKTPAKNASKKAPARPATTRSSTIHHAETDPMQSAPAQPATDAALKPAKKTVAKKDVQKLQRAIVDGLEDVKAQDIVVFDTEHLSPLFERVIVASGTSNRQTKALAASVMDAVREAGFAKPRLEGEANGEWIIVDCGQAVVHVMQPTFRSYYNLEELWGEKPVRLKLGAAKPTVLIAASGSSVAKGPAKPNASLRRSSAAKKGVEDAFPSKAQLRKAAESQVAELKKVAKKLGGISARGTKDTQNLAKPKVRTLVVNAPAKPVSKKAGGRTTSKPASKTVVSRKPPVRKA